MKYLYKDLLRGIACCDNCERWVWIEIDGEEKMFCPEQEGVVPLSGHCLAYVGFFAEKEE